MSLYHCLFFFSVTYNINRLLFLDRLQFITLRVKGTRLDAYFLLTSITNEIVPFLPCISSKPQELLFCSMLTSHIATVLPLDAVPLLMPSVNLLVYPTQRVVLRLH